MPPSEKRTTVKDIARVAQVHFTTVSLALRGHPRIPPETRDRILRLAKKMNYQRDPVMFALTARRAKANLPQAMPGMAFLTTQPDQASFDVYPHFRYFYEGAKQQAQALGYGCELLFVGQDKLTGKALEEYLNAHHVEGLIVGAFEPEYGSINLDWSKYAVVKIDSQFIKPDVAFVSNDQMQVVRLAHRRLRALGYRRIGMCVGRKEEEATHDLYATGCKIEQAFLPPSERIPPLHFYYHDNTREAAPRFRAWVRSNQLDCVISSWEYVIDLAKNAGLRVPQDIACACLSLSDPNEQLAGVIQNHHVVGQKAAQTIALSLKTGQRGIPMNPSSMYVEGVWKDGPSAPLLP
jgi:DNA-binding LacI/PurR family transcriptional regulator